MNSIKLNDLFCFFSKTVQKDLKMNGLRIARQLSTASSGSALVNPPIAFFGANGRYVNALYSAAFKSKKLDAVEDDLKKISSTIQKDNKFKEFLINPLINVNEKKSILTKVLNEKFKATDLTINAINLMAENRRLGLLPQISKDFEKIMANIRNEVNCTVYTAHPITDSATKKSIEDALRGFTSKKLLIELKVDPSIVGGLIVDFGDSYIDMSIRSKLKTYTTELKATV